MNLNVLQKTILKMASRRRLESFVVAVLSVAAFSAAAQTTNGTDFASFEIISQRNIFNQNRMPHTRSVQAPPPVVDSFALVGTMSYSKGEFAFFNGSGSEFRKVLQVNGEIANFKVADITPNSVTLTNGTNRVVLNLRMQMRRDDNGHWAVSPELASYASSGSSYRSSSQSRFSSNSRRYYNSSRSTAPAMGRSGPDNMQADDTNPPDQEGMPPPESEENPSEVSAPPGGGGNDALSRLMQRRAREEQQIGQ